MVTADPKITYVQVASENDGVGVCMGAWLGGMKPALLVENTGFTLGTYALLRGPMAFGVPLLLLISHRGELGDERWFSVPFGWGTKPLLDGMRSDSDPEVAATEPPLEARTVTQQDPFAPRGQ